MEIDENGVVNPLRAPAFVRDGLRSVRARPPIALAFVALAGIVLAVSIVERGAFEPSLVARAVTVLFPTAILWRRPDATTVTPRLFRGAALLSIAVVAATAIRLVSSLIPVDESFADEPSSDLPRLSFGAIVALVTVVGWALVGTALADLRRSRGSAARALAAIVAGCAIAIGTGFVLLGLQTSGGTPPATLIAFSALEASSWTVTAFVAWVLVSRVGGLPRPATIGAAAGVVIQVVGSLPSLVIALAILATRSDDWIALQATGFAILSAAMIVPPFLYAFAFAAGLGDPPAEPVAGPEGAIG
jgi:hypothetical protein